MKHPVYSDTTHTHNRQTSHARTRTHSCTHISTDIYIHTDTHGYTRTKVPTHLTQLSSRHNSKALLCKSSPKHQHTSTDTNTSADTNTLTPIPTLTLIPTRSLDSAVSRPLGHSAQLSIFPDTLPRWWRMCVDTPVQFLAGCGRCGLCVCVCPHLCDQVRG